MINLKLAEYDLKTGKFHKFLELSRTDLNIFISWFDGDPIIDSKGDGFLLGKERVIVFLGGSEQAFMLDKKDPLNRCNGIFNGLTYGEGRFILIENDNFSIYQQKFFCKNMEKFGYGLSLGGKISCSLKNFSEFGNKYIDTMLPEKIGNLFENPELYEKIK